MSEAIITRRGGGSMSPNSAVIHVSAPVGSTVTFAKGGVVAKTIPASKAHTNSTTPVYTGQTRYADYYYTVTQSNYGSWTVTATRGSETASKTVSVSSNLQYDVELTYNLYFIRNGVVQSGFTENRAANDSSFTVTKHDGYIQTHIEEWFNYGTYYFTPATSVAAYKYLACECQGRGFFEAATNNAFGLLENPSSSGSSTWAENAYFGIIGASTRDFNARTLRKLDIAGLTGRYRPGIQVHSRGPQGEQSAQYLGEARIWNMYLTNEE